MSLLPTTLAAAATWLAVLALLAPSASPARQPGNATVLLDGTRITGNAELPKVLFLLPWQAPDGPDGLAQPPDLDVDQLLSPLSPGAWRRAVRLRALLQQSPDPAQSLSPDHPPQEP